MLCEKHANYQMPSDLFTCRHCSKQFELWMAGCVPENMQGVEVCNGPWTFHMRADVELEYDSLCAKCYHDKTIPREPGLTDTLFSPKCPWERRFTDVKNFPFGAEIEEKTRGPILRIGDWIRRMRGG